MSVCACGNVATDGGLCEWCAFHAECVGPEGVRPYRGWLTGEPLWACQDCGSVFACVECVCELDHECVSPTPESESIPARYLDMMLS